MKDKELDQMLKKALTQDIRDDETKRSRKAAIWKMPRRER